jgi:hypothetical protein
LARPSESVRLYLILFGIQTIGALIIIRIALPLYRAVVADPAAHQVRVDRTIWALVAMALMQAGFWLRHRLQPPPPQFRNALIGYLIWFLGRMSFLLATAVFGFVFIVRRPELNLPASRYFLTLALLFAYFCYTQEVERLGKSLIETGYEPGSLTRNETTRPLS